MLVPEDRPFHLYRHDETFRSLRLKECQPMDGPVLLIESLGWESEVWYVVTEIRLYGWHPVFRSYMMELTIAAKFSNRDAAIMAYKLLGGV